MKTLLFVCAILMSTGCYAQDVLNKEVLTQEDRELLKWAKEQKANSAKYKEMGHDKYMRANMWARKAKVQFDAVMSGDNWSKVDENRKLDWIKLAKLNQSGLIGETIKDQLLKGIVEGDTFTITGRFGEIEMFGSAVQGLSHHNNARGDFGDALDTETMVLGLLKQTEEKKGTDDKNPVKLSWRLKDQHGFDFRMVIPINEVIEIWPGELAIIGGQGIVSKCPSSAITKE